MIAPKRILPSSTPPPQRPAPPPATRKHVLRVSQACTSCRRQKMRCEGADNPPCVRCRVSSTECIFEKTPKPQPMDPSVLERLAEMEHEIQMIKATQRQMQTMLSEVLNEFRRRSGHPLPSHPTENPVTSSSNAVVVLPAVQTSSPGSMPVHTTATYALATSTQSGGQLQIPSNSHSVGRLSADLDESRGSSPPPPTEPNQLSRKRKRIASRRASSPDHHHNTSRRSRSGSSSRNAKHQHRRSNNHGIPLLPTESKEQDAIDKGTFSQNDAEQLFALYAYLPHLWS